MDTVAVTERAMELFRKYRYVALVLLVGLILMALPEKKTEQIAPSPPQTAEQPTLEEALEEILSQLQGAGKVRVLLTRASGEETVYQMDRDSGADDLRTETVVITSAEREEAGLVRQVNPPEYLGAVIVCQGADNAAVKLSIVEAVANATGLTTDKISVLKMK